MFASPSVVSRDVPTKGRSIERQTHPDLLPAGGALDRVHDALYQGLAGRSFGAKETATNFVT
jgi:hypothetical protein